MGGYANRIDEHLRRLNDPAGARTEYDLQRAERNSFAQAAHQGQQAQQKSVIDRIIPMAPTMTPEQLAYWLRGLASADLIAVNDPREVLGIIFDAAQRAVLSTKPPCACGGHR